MATTTRVSEGDLAKPRLLTVSLIMLSAGAGRPGAADYNARARPGKEKTKPAGTRKSRRGPAVTGPGRCRTLVTAAARWCPFRPNHSRSGPLRRSSVVKGTRRSVRSDIGGRVYLQQNN